MQNKIKEQKKVITDLEENIKKEQELLKVAKIKLKKLEKLEKEFHLLTINEETKEIENVQDNNI